MKQQPLELPQEEGKRALPPNWRLVRLGEVCEIIMGQSPPGETYSKIPDGLPFFQGKADFGHKHPVARTWCSLPTKIALQGDILISVRAPVGPTNIADAECCIGRGLSSIRPGSRADRDFILAALKLYENSLAQLGSGATFSAINRVHLESLEIPFPPLTEQRRIAALLNGQIAAVERARAAAQAQLDAAKDLPAAYLRAVFLSPEAQKWSKRKLGEIAILERGKFTPRPRNDPKYFGGTYPWIQIGEVESAQKYITQYNNTLNDLGLEVSKMFHKGTLVLSIAATIGAVGILTFDSCMPDSLVGVTPREGLSDTNFLYYLLLFIRDHLQKIAPQMAQANLKLQILAPLEIPIPSISEQRLIGSFLDQKMMGAERLIQTLERELATINGLPAAFLRRAFNGEL
jgi:type I restriction enzyme S subunit